jgi:hypothetical protein
MKKTFAEFLASKNITDAIFAEMEAEQKAELYNEYNTQLKSYIEELEKKMDDAASKEELNKAISQLTESRNTEMKLMQDNLKEIGLRMKSLSEGKSGKGVQKSLREYIEENSEVLKAIKAAGKEQKGHAGFTMQVEKGTQGATDIGSRDYLGTIEAGIERKPVRRTTILDLFGRQPVSTEYLHYWEENVVTRDAKFVIACAASTHNTKKTWAKRTVELAKIRDIVDICIDMLDDYAFVEGEIRALVDESIALKAEYELLLGASAAPTDMLSIDFISSEFNAANPLADFEDKIQDPTIGDLVACMKAQIYEFGQQNKWQADTVLMNYTDMVTYLLAKNSEGNYLFPNFVFGATDQVNGMRIVTSPLVPQNELYVMDSTRGKILDRKRVTVTASFENKDNIERELVTMVGVERLQFHVRTINRDAFMKCSDIAAAITAITKP